MRTTSMDGTARIWVSSHSSASVSRSRGSSPREDHLPDFSVGRQVGEGRLQHRLVDRFEAVVSHVTAGAVATVYGALLGGEEHDSVGIAADQTGNGCMSLLIDGIVAQLVSASELPQIGNDHFDDGIVQIEFLGQRQVVWSGQQGKVGCRGG